MKPRTLFQTFLSVFLVLALFDMWMPASVHGPAISLAAGTTWYVDASTGNDANSCLSAASACQTIGAAVNKAASGDTIQIAAGTYNEYDILVSKDLTLNGAGAATTIVDAGAAGRVFYTTATVVISGLTLQNGQTPSSYDLFTAGGGAVLNSGQLTLQDSVLQNNHAAGDGGAVFNNGTLALTNTQVLSNTAGTVGGGLYNYNLGSITVTHSTLSNNSAASDGGGIYAGGTGLTIQESVIANNTAGTFGGGLEVILNGTVTLTSVTLRGNQANSGAALAIQLGTVNATNLTVSGNNASNNYGGIYAFGSSVNLSLKNSTIAYNTRTSTTGNGFNGVMHGGGATVSMINTILAYNEDKNCASSSPPTSLGHNLSSDYTCGLTQPGDQPGVNPLLGALANNGGWVETHALLPGSPAIDAGDNGQCPATDARGIARPYDGNGDSTAVCDIGAVEARHQLSIADVTVTEGNSGTVNATFTVTLAPANTNTVTVDYATADGTASAGSDYNAAAGTLTFSPGETSKTISVAVIGDTTDELDETFSVQLSNAVNADLLDALAAGTIVDDDGLPTLSIADQTVTEQNSGSVAMSFQVTLSPASTSVVTVDYATVNGTASAGSDYTAASGTLTFNPAETNKTITVTVQGDVVDEGTSETFTVQLSNPTNAALADGSAVGTIADDDTAGLAMSTANPQVQEGSSGTTPLVFTVTLSTPAAFPVTVDYATSDGYQGAVAGQDYQAASGTLTIPAGQTSGQITVLVLGDTLPESNEVFNVTLSNPNPVSIVGATQSIATILNDDYGIYLPLIVK